MKLLSGYDVNFFYINTSSEKKPPLRKMLIEARLSLQWSMVVYIPNISLLSVLFDRMTFGNLSKDYKPRLL